MTCSLFNVNYRFGHLGALLMPNDGIDGFCQLKRLKASSVGSLEWHHALDFVDPIQRYFNFSWVSQTYYFACS